MSEDFDIVAQFADLKCGQSVKESCIGATVPYNDAGFQQMVNYAVQAAGGAITVAKVTVGETLSWYEAQALNSAGCTVESLGTGAWHFIAAAWYLFKAFGQEDVIKE